MTRTTKYRDNEVGAFFSLHADRLHSAVRRRAASAGHAAIEDACQIAWTKLLRRPDVTLDARGFAWLATVAVHEAWRLGSTAYELPAGAFISSQYVEREHGEMPEPADREHRGTDDKALDRIEHDERVLAIQTLKPHDRQALYLKGAGYKYEEIARLTGATYTAVNRRITEGRAALRRHIDEDSPARRSIPAKRTGVAGGESAAMSP